MNIRQLEYFVGICDEMNFTRAAEKLCVSQTALTKQMHLLEDEFGAELFDRNQKKIKLTSAGEFFYEEASRAVRQFAAARSNMTAFLEGSNGTFRVGFLKSLNAKRLVKCMSLFKKEYPDMTLGLCDLTGGELYRLLDCGELDCIIAPEPEDHEQYRSVLVHEYPLAVLMNKDDELAGTDGLEIRRLRHVVYDMRSQGDYDGLDGVLLEISCFGGRALVYSFIEIQPYADFLTMVRPQPEDSLRLSLVYREDNHHMVIEKFVKTMQKEFYS